MINLRRFGRALLAATVLLCLTISAVDAQTVFRRGNSGEPDSLDPHLTTTGYAGNIISDMFIGLTAVDAAAKVIPGAAESWTVSPDGKVYTFKMRAGMQWSDGRPVTAGDFVYSFRRMLDPATAARGAPMLYMIENAREVNRGAKPVAALGVRAIDPATFEVRLVNPTPYFLELIVHRCPPAPQWAVEKYGAEWTRPQNIVVNGPFILKEWLPQTKVTLVRNPKFYDAANVALDVVEHHNTEDLAASFARYRAGELDVAIAFPPALLDEIKTTMPKELRIVPILGLEYFVFNTRKPPFNDARVRTALSMVLDREAIAEKVARGGEIPAHSLIPPGAREGYVPPPAPWVGLPMAERITKAKAMLAEAGYGPAKPLRFSFRYNTSEVQKRIAVAAASMWKAVGADVELLNSDFNMVNASLRNGDYDAARYQWLAEYTDPASFLYLLESVNVGDNHAKYANPAFDELMNKAHATVDRAARAALMQQAEALALNESPLTPVTYYVAKRLVKTNVSGWEDNVRGINQSRWVRIKR
jgi:ABC-type oligopeptide transport system substrate-binding subunit